MSLVSTIIPVHNRAALLKEAVNSVLAQTYRPIEIIIVDDGSTDDTAAVADEFAQKHPGEIFVVHQSNTGPGLARESGRQRARGEFIQYLDSDDLLLPRKFELQVAGLASNADCAISYGMTRFYRKGDSPNDIAWKRTGEKINQMFPSFLQSRWWGTSTPLYRKNVTDLNGPWMELRSEEDWEYDCRIAARDIRLHFVPEFISEEREHDGDRLSRGGTTAAKKLRDRAAAHALIFEYASTAGLTSDDSEMQFFARELFLLSRQCGAAKLHIESKQLFLLARIASGGRRGKGWDFRLYRILASTLGWTCTAKLATYSDRLRFNF